MGTRQRGGLQVGLSIDEDIHTVQGRLTHESSLRTVRGCVKKATGSKATLPAFPAPYAPAGCISPAIWCLTPAERTRRVGVSCAERRRPTPASVWSHNASPPAARHRLRQYNTHRDFSLTPICCVVSGCHACLPKISTRAWISLCNLFIARNMLILSITCVPYLKKNSDKPMSNINI